MLQYVCEEYFQTISGKSIFTGLKAKTHFGRPNFEQILKQVSDKHPGVSTEITFKKNFFQIRFEQLS